jgi:hypothetical protein
MKPTGSLGRFVVFVVDEVSPLDVFIIATSAQP